jgi:flagellar biosynthesis/type III secretory pathway M-ring protein FliF/YscJ
MDFLIVLVVLAVVVFVVMAPLRRDRANGESAAAASSGTMAELEAEREAKYREIRDADLDHRTGKLSDADYEAVDGALRAEAVEIMHQIDRMSDEQPSAPSNGEVRKAPADPPGDAS